MKILTIAVIESSDIIDKNVMMCKITNANLSCNIPKVDLVLRGPGNTIEEMRQSLVKEFDLYGHWCELKNVKK